MRPMRMNLSGSLCFGKAIIRGYWKLRISGIPEGYSDVIGVWGVKDGIPAAIVLPNKRKTLLEVSIRCWDSVSNTFMLSDS